MFNDTDVACPTELAVARAWEICDARLEEAEKDRLLRKVKAAASGLEKSAWF